MLEIFLRDRIPDSKIPKSLKSMPTCLNIPCESSLDFTFYRYFLLTFSTVLLRQGSFLESQKEL